MKQWLKTHSALQEQCCSLRGNWYCKTRLLLLTFFCCVNDSWCTKSVEPQYGQQCYSFYSYSTIRVLSLKVFLPLGSSCFYCKCLTTTWNESRETPFCLTSNSHYVAPVKHRGMSLVDNTECYNHKKYLDVFQVFFQLKPVCLTYNYISHIMYVSTVCNPAVSKGSIEKFGWIGGLTTVLSLWGFLPMSKNNFPSFFHILQLSEKTEIWIQHVCNQSHRDLLNNR